MRQRNLLCFPGKRLQVIEWPAGAFLYLRQFAGICYNKTGCEMTGAIVLQGIGAY
ncbi:hypothetical protein [Anaerolentibacter hominis]|uniref:hypothetical protein n=1 Tax=Anaerolentibacter hominis TaxID=3079009 RepID=UPI0031B8B27F